MLAVLIATSTTLVALQAPSSLQSDIGVRFESLTATEVETLLKKWGWGPKHVWLDTGWFWQTHMDAYGMHYGVGAIALPEHPTLDHITLSALFKTKTSHPGAWYSRETKRIDWTGFNGGEIAFYSPDLARLAATISFKNGMTRQELHHRIEMFLRLSKPYLLGHQGRFR